MYYKWIGNSKWPLGVSVSGFVCLSHRQLTCPGEPRPPPSDCWDRHSSLWPRRGASGLGKWMDGLHSVSHWIFCLILGKTVVKRKWTVAEIKAVEKEMMRFILSGQVPGKKDCEDCLDAYPDVLKHRDWRSIKYYVHNRITARKRELTSHCWVSEFWVLVGNSCASSLFEADSRSKPASALMWAGPRSPSSTDWRSRHDKTLYAHLRIHLLDFSILLYPMRVGQRFVSGCQKLFCLVFSRPRLAVNRVKKHLWYLYDFLCFYTLWLLLLAIGNHL